MVGAVDLGSTCNNIDILMSGKKQVRLATHALQYIYQGFGGFRWPIGFFASATATASQLFFTFWEAVDTLAEYDFHVHYCMLDGASTNRSFTSLLFTQTPRESLFTTRNMYSASDSIVILQDIQHVLKKVRNNVEASKKDHNTQGGRYLILDGTPILWEHWMEAFAFNQRNILRIHKKLTKEHLEITPTSKMRNKLAREVLDADMLYLMQAYQNSSQCKNPRRLDASIKVLKNTSVLVDIFSDKHRPVKDMSDTRLDKLLDVLAFFNTWEQNAGGKDAEIKQSPNLITKETREDINSAITGFIQVCKKAVSLGLSVNPGFFNSDGVENFFCQQRGLRNGMNTNPTLAQYGPGTNAIILGQIMVSRKSNSGGECAAKPFAHSVGGHLNARQKLHS